MDIDSYLLAVIGVFVGAYIVIKSIYDHSKSSNFVENGVKTQGTIFQIEKSYMLMDDDLDDSKTYKTVYYPVVEYITEDNKELVCELKNEFSTNKHSFKIGEPIELVYNQDKPHIAVRKNHADLNWVNLIFLAVGVFMLFYSALTLIQEIDS